MDSEDISFTVTGPSKVSLSAAGSVAEPDDGHIGEKLRSPVIVRPIPDEIVLLENVPLADIMAKLRPPM